MTGLIVLVATLAVATVAGLTMRARNGRMRVTSSDAPAGAVAADSSAPGIDLEPFGVEPGARATLLQFSSAFCAPCRSTRTMLADVAAEVPGVRHVEVDVADGDAALDLVRRLDIRRTPTTLVLDARAQEIRRASGVPRREQVLAALGEAVAAPPAGPGAPASEGRPGDVR